MHVADLGDSVIALNSLQPCYLGAQKGDHGDNLDVFSNPCSICCLPRGRCPCPFLFWGRTVTWEKIIIQTSATNLSTYSNKCVDIVAVMLLSRKRPTSLLRAAAFLLPSIPHQRAVILKAVCGLCVQVVSRMKVSFRETPYKNKNLIALWPDLDLAHMPWGCRGCCNSNAMEETGVLWCSSFADGQRRVGPRNMLRWSASTCRPWPQEQTKAPSKKPAKERKQEHFYMFYTQGSGLCCHTWGYCQKILCDWESLLVGSITSSETQGEDAVMAVKTACLRLARQGGPWLRSQ